MSDRLCMTAEALRERNARHQRAYYARKRAAGLCVRGGCHEEVSWGNRCELHRAPEIERRLKARAKAKASSVPAERRCA